MSGSNSNGSTAWIWMGVLVLALLSALLSSNSNNVGSSASSSYSPVGVDRSSAEYRYAKERVKLEGYSDREAQQVADAIIKFHNAQQNR